MFFLLGCVHFIGSMYNSIIAKKWAYNTINGCEVVQFFATLFKIQK